MENILAECGVVPALAQRRVLNPAYGWKRGLSFGG